MKLKRTGSQTVSTNMLNRIISLLSVVCVCRAQDFTGRCHALTFNLMEQNCHSHFGNLTWDGINPFPNRSDLLYDLMESDKKDTICQQQRIPAITKYYECTYEIFSNCAPPYLQKALPLLEDTKASLCLLCEHKHDFNYACVEANEDALEECWENSYNLTEIPDLALEDGTWVAFICRHAPTLIHCLKTINRDCPGRTAEILERLYTYMKPSDCEDGYGSDQILKECDNGATTRSRLASTIVPGLMVLLGILGSVS